MKTNAISFDELEWDSEFFGVSSAKVTLHQPLVMKEWKELKSRFKNYQFISIVNKHAEPINAQFIGKDSSSFLVDVNVQFQKKTATIQEKPTNIKIYQALKSNDSILEMANFQFSKFIEDPNLASRGGDQVYRQWLINAFEKPDKYYAISTDKLEKINGFTLFSFSDNSCVIELIAVSPTAVKGGIGTSLFNAVEYEACIQGANKIKVGTQMRNRGAINFYNKMGCRQVDCHQVFHLWNL